MGQIGHSSPQQWSEEFTAAYMGLPPPTRWSVQRANGKYKDHLVGQLTITTWAFILGKNMDTEVGAHLFFLKKKWRFFHRKWWHFKWITDVGENIGERKGDILGELLEIVTFLSPFLTPFSVKIFSPNKVTISSPKMVSFLVSHKNWWIFWWRKRWFSKWIADREKFF